jgi:hypothetical protein
VSDLDAGLLVRRTRLLLRFYPPAYRAHRGEEILGTLLETTRPGQGWPPAREVASVIGGGLRARRAANLSQGLGASLRHAGILAAAMTMAGDPAFLLNRVGLDMANPFPGPVLSAMVPGLVLASLLAVTALAATWCGRRRLVAAAAAAAALAAVAWWSVAGEWQGNTMLQLAASPVVLALVVLLPLTKRAERPPASLLWLPCLTPAVSFLEGLAAGSRLHVAELLPLPVSEFRLEVLLDPYYTYLSLVPVLVAVCWLVTDVRPLAAITLMFLLERVFFSATVGDRAATWTQMAIAAGLPLALTCALIWLLRHRARTVPPTIG